MKTEDINAFIDAIKTKVKVEVPAAILVHIAQSLAEKHQRLSDTIEVISQAGGDTSELKMTRDANEVVAVEILSILSENFGMKFLEMVFEKDKPDLKVLH